MIKSGTRTTSSASTSLPAACPRRRPRRRSSAAPGPVRGGPGSACRRGPQCTSSTRPRSAPNPVTGKRVTLIVDRYELANERQGRDGRPRHAEGRRQRRRLPADDRELHGGGEEPLRRARARRRASVEWPALELHRRLQDLPLRPGRDGRAARPRPARRARRARRGARSVRAAARARCSRWRPASTSPRPARCARSGARSRALDEAELAALPRARARDRLPERQPLARAVGAGERRDRAAARRPRRTPRARRARRSSAFGLGGRARRTAPPRCRAASSSASRSPRRRRARRRSCSPTSRPASSTGATSAIVLEALAAPARRPRRDRGRRDPLRRGSPPPPTASIELRDGRRRVTRRRRRARGARGAAAA